jgi:hypothetical protein
MGVWAAVAEGDGEADADDDGDVDASSAWMVALTKLRASNALTTIDGLRQLVMVCRKTNYKSQMTNDR